MLVPPLEVGSQTFSDLLGPKYHSNYKLISEIFLRFYESINPDKKFPKLCPDEMQQTMLLPNFGSDMLIWSVHKPNCNGQLRRYSSIDNSNVWITLTGPKPGCYYRIEVGGNFVAICPYQTPLTPLTKLLVICQGDGTVHSELDFSEYYEMLKACRLSGSRIAIHGNVQHGNGVDILVADLKTGNILFRCLNIFGFDLRDPTFLMDEKQLVVFHDRRLHSLRFCH